MSVDFTDSEYRVLNRAKGRIMAETGNDPNWHDALLQIMAHFSRCPNAMAERGRKA